MWGGGGGDECVCGEEVSVCEEEEEIEDGEMEEKEMEEEEISIYMWGGGECV